MSRGRRQPADLGVDVLAAGAVLWRPGAGGEPEVALVHRPRYDDWSIPKGKVDPGETLPLTAVREVGEETGYAVRLGARLGDVRYPVAEGDKLVRYWAARSVGGPGFTPNHETDVLRFLPLSQAREQVSYDRDREILDVFAALPDPTSVLLLVRHGRAGSRADWDGDDHDRPLSRNGRDEAEALRAFLALFRPDRVHSAPPERCRATVAPLAADLGLDLVDEPALGEQGFHDDPDGGRARLRELAGLPGVTVVCSQGGVIPDALAALLAGSAAAERTPMPSGNPPARKASTWVVGGRAGHPLFADYYADTSG